MVTTERKLVMVIYGHDTEANNALFDWLRAIGLQPQEWCQIVGATGNTSPYIGQALEQAFRDTQAVVAFFTPDERVLARNASPKDRGIRANIGVHWLDHYGRGVRAMAGKGIDARHASAG